MEFIVYSKKGCPYCDKIKKVLELSKQEHIIKILDEDFCIDDYLVEFGPKAPFPQIILSNENKNSIHLGGCVQTVKFLKENNII